MKRPLSLVVSGNDRGIVNIFSMEHRVTSELSIVIVEEPCLSRNVMIKALRAWGYACTVADDDDAAWTALRAAAGPCLALVDWHADFLECVEFFDRIRKSPELNGTYILSAIPRGFGGAIRESLAAGADDFVFRPYDLDEVRVRLHIASRIFGLEPDGSVFASEDAPSTPAPSPVEGALLAD